MWRFFLVGVLFVSCAPTSDVQLFAVDFGTVPVGEVRTASLRVKNNGADSSTLRRIEQRDDVPGFKVVPVLEPLPAGAETTWTVQYDAQFAGAATARFVAVFDDGESEVTLTAFGAERCRGIVDLDFGPGPIGPRTLTVRVGNPTATPGQVTSAALSPPFSTSFAGSAVLNPGETLEIEVRFDGDAPGVFEQRWFVSTPLCLASETRLVASVEQPAIIATPGRLHFGDDATQLKVELRNTTRTAVELMPRIEGGGFKLPDERKFTIAANGTVELTVLREDFTTTPLFRELAFSTNTYPRDFRIPLLARTTTGCVTAMESSVAFAAQEKGCSTATRFVTLKNDCPHEVKIGAPRTDAPFAIIAAKPGSLAAGATARIGVAMRSETVGAQASALTVPIDVLDGSEDVVVALTGTSTEAVLRDERRVIPVEVPPVDVLLVIDDTAAMSEFASALNDNLGSLNASLSANGVNPKYAVLSTSTAANEQGRLRAGWLTEPSSMQLQTYAAHRGAQTAPSSCLEAIATAFSAPLRDDPQHMGGFRRSGAALMVVCITANADDTKSPSSVLFTRIRELTPKETYFGVIARFTPGAVCGGTRDTGTLSAFIGFNNGVKEELCTPDWGVALERIGKTASFGYRTTHHLAEFPDLERAPLRVFIDAAEIPQRDPDPVFNSRIWSYLSSSNAVSFEPIYVPEPGRTLRLTYAGQCSQ